MAHVTANTLTQKEKARFPRGWALGIGLFILAMPFLPEVVHVTLGSNFHTVVAQRLYRAGQPSAASLDSTLRAYAIRTVINLRGPNDGQDWFEEEKAVAQRNGVKF